MPHDRKRHISELYNKLMKFSPILGIFGHRQVGKSTFIANVVKEYRTLDDVDELKKAHLDPKTYVRLGAASLAPLAIDECQLEPQLFPTLKEWVRTHKKPGQFVLSGSVRFTSRKAIRESLAGRLSFLEMLPFSVAELANEPLSDVVFQIFSHQIFSSESVRCLNSNKKSAKFKKQTQLYLEQGGLPGLCFIRNSQIKKNALNELHELMLGRDIKLVSETKVQISTIKKLMSYIADHSFEPYNASEVRRLLGLAPQTQKTLLSAMESIFLIRRIPLPLQKKEILLLEDQLEETTYASTHLPELRRMESAVYRNIRTQFAYRIDKDVVFESYLTRDHARVPIVIKSNSKTLGIIVTPGETPTLSEIRSANSFLRKYADSKVLYLSNQTVSAVIFDERSMLTSIFSVI